MREVIHALKYERLRPAARRLGALLAKTIATLGPDVPNDLLVVPVPLHRSKSADRGFNQARLLAVEAVASLRKTHRQWHLELAPSALIRSRATDSQAGLTQRKRRQNVRGAFRVSEPAAVKGKNILLVDDILTTGATARACARALRSAGAQSVWVVTLARAYRTHPASFADAGFPNRSDNSPSAGHVLGLNPQLATMNSQNQPSF